MDFLKIWGISICFSAIAGGVLHVLFPGTCTKRIFETCVSVFVLCAVVSPLAGADWEAIMGPLTDAGTAAVDNEKYKNMAEERVVSSFRENIENIIAVRLRESGIEYKNIEIFFNIDDSGSISITKARITAMKIDNAAFEEFSKRLQKDLSFKAEFVTE